MRSHGNRKRVTATQALIYEGGCYKVFAQPAILLGKCSAQKTQFSGFIKQGWHDAVFLLVDLNKMRCYFLLDKLLAHRDDHTLFIVEIFGCEHVCRVGRL